MPDITIKEDRPRVEKLDDAQALSASSVDLAEVQKPCGKTKKAEVSKPTALSVNYVVSGIPRFDELPERNPLRNNTLFLSRI
jgi:hypothetical protein